MHAAPKMKSVLRRQEKRRAARDVKRKQLFSDRGKKPRIALGADNQLFRGKKKSLLFTLYIHVFWIRLRILPYFSCADLFVLRELI